MALETWWLFAGMTFFISATPGPNMLLVMRSGATHGFGRALGTMAGCMSALLLMFGLSAVGLGALLKAFPLVFDTLRLVGALYLAYLGVRCWRAPVAADVVDAADAIAAAETGVAPHAGAATSATACPSVSDTAVPPAGLGRRVMQRLYREGFLVSASNPKAILFAAAFLPQFIRADQPQLPQFGILLLTFVVIEGSWYAVYGSFGQRLSAYLQRAGVRRAFNRLTGGLFVGFAALMALAREG